MKVRWVMIPAGDTGLMRDRTALLPGATRQSPRLRADQRARLLLMAARMARSGPSAPLATRILTHPAEKLSRGSVTERQGAAAHCAHACQSARRRLRS